MIDDGIKAFLSPMSPLILASLMHCHRCFLHTYKMVSVCCCWNATITYTEIFISAESMDSNASSYLLNHSTLPQVYYQGKEGDNIIDLGLSLRVLQPEAHHPSPHADDFDVLIDWHRLHPQLENSKTEYPQTIVENYVDQAEGAQSKERWAYVKVNMDGVLVGRKICILDHMGYSALALQLEEMFGKQSASGLRLFQAVSEFSLLYRDRNDQWRTVGDVPWKDFVGRVRRLRIVRKDEAFVPSSSALLLNSL